ncbi:MULTISPECIES: PTS lactose/cellobiose transporter subunit IIA [unclassified Symbiopectobacterium]|uniref:PTS lactose/cellobiose transporter subunit IIA n=1 Tax=unclassified Symbiopectobacterium TaxID=2794573 RepID=UPI00222683DF|nr:MULTISPECIES: PTS lactose/cellobiose transporter subunit IIA [unclassified Symbiopectobacterium]MCW2473147.1 PTS lactose/cellobiose transporter subunit IIA [Candidatus Symbiopectobacterium sp. NZEC151]MCW2482068.1 PTS lactose/cellobiose transporter subunit IIA [Candidatus Symbiopectobacterium sp. NZEC135]MCW2484319.1 PTS lactose/cellobiose transporter subunit IIA [Candidatus Symbiopectobacterium sp. NZEC127]
MNEQVDSDFEELVINIIVNAGQARSHAIKAIECAARQEFAPAQELLEQATEALRVAHQAQTNLIEDEARGVHHPVTLLMVHAQDHLMNAITVKDLARQQVACYQHMAELSKQVQALSLTQAHY